MSAFEESAPDNETGPDCAICDKNFTKEHLKERHFESAKHYVQKMRKDMGGIFGLNLDAGKHYVYCIVVSPLSDEREFYYVGTSKKPFQRIYTHMRDTGESHKLRNVPSKDGEKLVRKEYEFVRCVDIEEHETMEKARLRERQKMFEIVKEHDVDTVLGGH